MTTDSEKERVPWWGSHLFVQLLSVASLLASAGAVVASILSSRLLSQETAIIASILLLFAAVWLLAVMLLYREKIYQTAVKRYQEEVRSGTMAYQEPGLELTDADTISRSRLSARRVRRLPNAERDRLLQLAAASVGQDYEEGGRLSGFQASTDTDLFDVSLPDE